MAETRRMGATREVAEPASGLRSELAVVDVNADLEGIAQDGGLEVRVAGGAPGDRLIVRDVHASPHRPVVWSEVVDVVSRGDAFRAPPCPHAAPVAGRCGGCPGMHLREDVARSAKLRAVTRTLEEGLGPDVAERLRGVQPSPRSFGWRNRSNFLVFRGEFGPRFGSFAPRSHEPADMTDCRMVRPGIRDTATRVVEVLDAHGLVPGGDADGLRWFSVRENASGEQLLELIGPAPASLPDALLDDMAALPGVVGVAASRNLSTGNAIRTERAVTVRGVDTIVEAIEGVPLRLSASAFFQLNTDVAAGMYRRAAELVEGAKVLWDVYCGVGGLGLIAAVGRPGVRIYGAELDADAVERARRTAAEIGVAGRWDRVDLSLVVPTAWERPDVALVNPPRRGIDAATLQTLLNVAPRRVLYMSCNPSTFVRDTRQFLDGGWDVDVVEAWDMMPMTTHVELLALLRRPATGIAPRPQGAELS